VLIGEFGDLLVNRKSTTYRGFSDFMRLSEADVQLPAHPAVMKRPVIQSSDAWYLGWEDKVQAALLG
jgi:arsenate reductase-like glutaredoxin family protein